MLTLEPRRVRQLLLWGVAALSLLTVASQAARQWVPGSTTENALKFFDAVDEASIPTFLSALALLACGALAAVIARAETTMAWRWRVLAVVLVALGVDEAIEFHETTVKPLRRLLDADGVLYYTWVVPGALFVIAAAAILLPLVTRLPRMQRRLFVAAAVLFFGGAIGLELAEGWEFDRHGEDSFTLVPLRSVEETLEMVGVVLMLYLLMLRAAPWSGTVRISP